MEFSGIWQEILSGSLVQCHSVAEMVGITGPISCCYQHFDKAGSSSVSPEKHWMTPTLIKLYNAVYLVGAPVIPED